MIINDYICTYQTNFKPNSKSKMEQVDFKQTNNRLSENGKNPVPVFVDESVGLVVSCWKPTFRERVKLLFSGKIYICMVATKKNVPATRLSVSEDEIFGGK